MNNSKIWLVVKPTVGVPLFLSAVAVGSFAVHVAVLSNTTWVSDFLSGEPLGTGMAAVNAPVATGGETASVYFGQRASETQTATVVLPDGRSATVTFDDPAEAAMVTDRRQSVE